ncbi:MAG TPA: [Fe-Fe] hydrogenase large subunit C-terminal domain-containing protein, partial [Armatimonadota bacterium]|nr:[Fe-Fe] hydrogenase large subunit C-terminal domain-containing protein [Armatimonadota bacterium]
MGDGTERLPVVYTDKAQCRDCYRCVRVCPVKAIRMQGGQASVDPGRCIVCGTCIRECPQGAKRYRSDLARAQALVAGDRPVAVSVAPSFASVYTPWEQRRLATALRLLGFAHVAETAVGAFYVAQATAEYCRARPGQSHIGTACPAVVSYVERHESELADRLVPVVSPMVAHGRLIREKLGADTPVVFVGPCVAKKAEADRPENNAVVDCVLTFTELAEWLQAAGVSLAACEESGFDDEPLGHARLFPLEGGCLRTACIKADGLSAEVVAVSGVDEVRDLLSALREGDRPLIVEPLFCAMGCVNGPAVSSALPVFRRRAAVLGYGALPGAPAAPAARELPGLTTTFSPSAPACEPVSEDQIRAALEATGKFSDEDELNCGACGYASCRDKAIAVVHGMAEPEMCIPYMRRLAEQRTDRIIETSPNGIVILDEDLAIVTMNPAFRRLFMCTDAVCGRPISYLMDPAGFERVASGQESVVNTVVSHERYGLVCRHILYALPEDRQYVGIFVNITSGETARRKLGELRARTLMQAQELLEHQIGMAQEIARYLGESAARGEQLVENLMSLA